jgi:hypothetical protein
MIDLGEGTAFSFDGCYLYVATSSTVTSTSSGARPEATGR